jgi:glycosyltransferase involved in cell wall biosynthesis
MREERGVVQHADALVLNTEALLESFRERYADSTEKMWAIPNGYDAPLDRSPVLEVERGRPIQILHAGALYGRRSPAAALQALAELIAGGHAKHDSFEFVFLGSASEELGLPGIVAHLKLETSVRIIPTVPKQGAIEFMRQADMLLLIQPQAPLQIPSKLFDYLTVGKPVFALVDEGATADLVRRSRIGLVAVPNDVEQIKTCFLQLMDADYVTKPDWDYLSRFSGESLSRRLEERLLSSR